MPDSRPRLCIVTGMAKVGKSTVCNRLAARLPSIWRVIHADDFCGPTFACYPASEWEAIRPFHFYFAGWSVGFYLARGQSVLIEGNFRTSEDVGKFSRAVEDRGGTTDTMQVCCLAGDPREIARRAVEDKGWEPLLIGPERSRTVEKWVPTTIPEEKIFDFTIETKELSVDEIATRLASVFQFGFEQPAHN